MTDYTPMPGWLSMADFMAKEKRDEEARERRRILLNNLIRTDDEEVSSSKEIKVYKVRYRYFTDKGWSIKRDLSADEAKAFVNTLDFTKIWALEVVDSAY